MSKRADFIFKIAIIAVAIFSIVALIVLRNEINNLQAEREQERKEMSSYQERIKELEEKLILPDYEFSEKNAEEKTGK